MKKEIVKIEGINNRPGVFHHVIRANGFLFLSSQLSCDLKTGEIIHGSIKEQTKRAMDNIKFLLGSCGGTMEDIVKVVIYMRDTKYRKEINEVYAQYFKEGTEPTKVSIQAISPVSSIDVEIETTAVTRQV
jgi:2-iminobutanoate/2-iminopropanoate deaminase